MPRNTSGTYTLPAGNPVTSGTTISTTWANGTLGDLAAEISDSVSRSGKGSFSAAVRAPDGTVAAPAYSFTNEIGSGVYRAAANDIRLAVGGVDALKLVAGGIAGPLMFPSGTTAIQVTLAGGFLLLQGNVAAADANNADVQLSSTASRTAGPIVAVQNPPGTSKLLIDYQGLLRLATPAAAIQPASIYTAITPNTNWTAANGLAYWKDAMGRVSLRGGVTFGVGAISPVFTLPVGFRPASNRWWNAPDQNQPNNNVLVQVTAAGAVNIVGATNAMVNGELVSFDVVTFAAEA